VKTLVRQEINHGAAARKGWKTVGWQGMTLLAPPAWNLVGYGGDAKSGNLRLDNGELQAQGVLGMDIRWIPVKSKITDADLEKRLRQYLDSVEKSAKRQKISAVVQIKAITDARHPERTGLRMFTWKADQRAVGRIWHCTECGRVVIAQVLGGTRGDFAATAADVLQTLECHAEDSNWRVWSLYDLETQIPSDYTLQGKLQLMNIYVQLPFGRGMTSDTITVEQWGVANVQLRNAYLDQWFRDKNRAHEGHLHYAGQESEAQGHPALALTGRRTGIAYWMSQGIPQVTRLQKPATYFEARVWECPETNKIFLVQSFSRRPQPEVIDEIVERTQCHG
jgi:hypothetical protein